MLLSDPPKGPYEAYLRDLNNALRTADELNRKKQQDLEVATPERLILSSPNGTRYQITVSNAGVVGATAL